MIARMFLMWQWKLLEQLYSTILVKKYVFSNIGFILLNTQCCFDCFKSTEKENHVIVVMEKNIYPKLNVNEFT